MLLTTKDQTEDQLAVLVLAAGKGSRMQSTLPKVLHRIAGKTMLEHVIASAKALQPKGICLVLPEDITTFEPVLNRFEELTLCSQLETNGTAGAVGVGGFGLKDIRPPSYAMGLLRKGHKINASHLIILAGDTPNLDQQVLKDFVSHCLNKGFDLAVCGMVVPEPKGYGRLIFDHKDHLKAIVEEKDAQPQQLSIKSCHSGVLFAKTKALFSLLPELTSNNNQQEYYLTDCIALANRHGLRVGAFLSEKWESFLGVNTKDQLHQLEARM